MTQVKLPTHAMSSRYVDSEHYRQMLVRDGERRFREWHTAFLLHQRSYRNQMAQNRYVQS
ncbi:MAG: hypothetical protein VKK04_08420 [Synechococcales bacterium]|nr:hypothetical protein [Synechococcales bacterium]